MICTIGLWPETRCGPNEKIKTPVCIGVTGSEYFCDGFRTATAYRPLNELEPWRQRVVRFLGDQAESGRNISAAGISQYKRFNRTVPRPPGRHPSSPPGSHDGSPSEREIGFDHFLPAGSEQCLPFPLA